MKAMIYLVLYFLSYSAAFAGVVVCVFARLRGGPRWLNLYLGWLLASIAFLLIRNLAYFSKHYLGFAAIESDIVFYLLYMITSSVFLAFLVFNSVYLVSLFKPRANVVATVLVAGVPIVFIPLLLVFELAGPNVPIRLLFVNVIMYYTFVGVDAVLVFLVLSRKRIADPFVKAIIDSDLLAGASYVALSVSQWFSYRNQDYSLDPFCVVNVSLFIMFLVSTIVIGREYLMGGKAEEIPELPDYLVSGLSGKEGRIVALIAHGLTNQEIAEREGMNIPAVKSAIYRIFVRYGVRSRAALIHALEMCRVPSADSVSLGGDVSGDDVPDGNAQDPAKGAERPAETGTRGGSRA